MAAEKRLVSFAATAAGGVVFGLAILLLIHVSLSPQSSSSKKSHNQPKIANLAIKTPRLNRVQQFGPLLELSQFRTGAEVGVRSGDFSQNLLADWTLCQQYYLIDPWAYQQNWFDDRNENTERQEQRLREAKERLQRFEPSTKLVWMRMTPTEAANKIPDESLDFVFIDWRHDACATLQNLQEYWPKVRLGGIIGGHDYIGGTESYFLETKQDWTLCADGSRKLGAVKSGVAAFLASMNIHPDELHLCEQDYINNNYPCWFLRKKQM